MDAAAGPAPGAGRAWARFDDMAEGAGTLFAGVERELVAWSADDVPALLDDVERASAAGRWAFGFVAYEAAPGIDPGLVTNDPVPDLPAAWFGLARDAEPVPPPSPPERRPGAPWRPVWTAERHRAAVRAVRERIADGDTYQCNLTSALAAPAPDDPELLYRALAAAQRGRYNAYVDTGRFVVVSASPELFFEITGDEIAMRPMKGTAARGRTEAEDADAVRRLRSSEKERAENIMIVDLVRNDLTRIAVPGGVAPRELLRAERFETVHQLTSTVTARLRDGVGLRETFRALFPCGSVTGAPKRRTMEIIRELEDAPRGVYCGAIGVVAPRGNAVRARFSVAIRTALVDRERGTAVYGAGGGITWGSDPAAEWAELLAKARVLDAPHDEFHLIETMRHEPGTGLRHGDAHLERVASSARYFGFRFDGDAVRRALARRLDGVGDARVRLRCMSDGSVGVDVDPPPEPGAGPVRLAVDGEPVDASTCWTRHKTSRRERYDAPRARHGDADDVVLVDGAGMVVETCIANVAVRTGGAWWTPPLDSGCLPGVERAALVASGRLRERPIAAHELAAADEVAVLNSLRGMRAAALTADGRATANRLGGR